MDVQIDLYLKTLKTELLDESNFKALELTRDWTNKFPSTAGVYVLKHNAKIVYVGETGNLRKRMLDLIDSRHHCVRRTLGVLNFAALDGFQKASTSTKFPAHIELLLNEHLTTSFTISFLQVPLGRKELEEEIEKSIGQDVKLNKRGKRKS